jgi:hypothetical protein
MALSRSSSSYKLATVNFQIGRSTGVQLYLNGALAVPFVMEELLALSA